MKLGPSAVCRAGLCMVLLSCGGCLRTTPKLPRSLSLASPVAYSGKELDEDVASYRSSIKAGLPGTVPVSGNLTMEGLAATLTSNEQLLVEQLTGLVFDKSLPRNLVTTVDYTGQVQLGRLRIVKRGDPSPGKKILSSTAYITGAKTEVDTYRLPLG